MQNLTLAHVTFELGSKMEITLPDKVTTVQAFAGVNSIRLEPQAVHSSRSKTGK